MFVCRFLVHFAFCVCVCVSGRLRVRFAFARQSSRNGCVAAACVVLFLFAFRPNGLASLTTICYAELMHADSNATNPNGSKVNAEFMDTQEWPPFLPHASAYAHAHHLVISTRAWRR